MDRNRRVFRGLLQAVFRPQPLHRPSWIGLAARERRAGAAADARQLTGDPTAPLMRVRSSESSRLPRAGAPFIIHWRHVAWRPQRWGQPAGSSWTVQVTAPVADWDFFAHGCGMLQTFSSGFRWRYSCSRKFAIPLFKLLQIFSIAFVSVADQDVVVGYS
jgi:hypothetical protein